VWIADLSPFGGSSRLVGVGWLERGREYPVGEVESEVYAKLEELFVDPWQPFVAAGVHPLRPLPNRPEQMGASNLFVPGVERVYIAPELILHYMNAHRYLPPDEFCRAVLKCPPMRSPEYRRRLLSAGGPEFLREAGTANMDSSDS
jgi:hypothetical protein